MEEKKVNKAHIWFLPDEMQEMTQLCKEIGKSKQVFIRGLVVQELKKARMDKLTRPWGIKPHAEQPRRLARVRLPHGGGDG